jgi:uroporphyrinogen III methyltransferase/synthase
MTISAGSRKSDLAVKQTEMVCAALKKSLRGTEIKTVFFSTSGDREKNKPLSEIGGKGVFTKELEEALLNGSADFAVHSAKDLPTEIPEGLTVVPVLERADVNDCAVTLSGTGLVSLKAGSTVGTGSIRREVQVREMNPKVKISGIRGNVGTRILKLKRGDYDCIILAEAGMRRAGLLNDPALKVEELDPAVFVPAACQGILAVELRSDDAKLLKAVRSISCPDTAIAFAAERSFLHAVGGDCSVPCGACCMVRDQDAVLYAMYCRGLQKPVIIRERCRKEEAAAVAENMARRLLGAI